MLVDDDSIARMKLKNLLQWEKINCRIAGEASSGREAIVQIEKCHPHIIITDIDMPGMNGVDLIQYTKKQHPEIYILALSAYDDYDYVRGSLKYGALDYMLKHQLTPRKLEMALQEAFSYTNEGIEKEYIEALDTEKDLLETVLGNLLLRKRNDYDLNWKEESFGENTELSLSEMQKDYEVLEELAGRYRENKFLLTVGIFRERYKNEDKKLKYLEGIIHEILSFHEWKVYWKLCQSGLIFLSFGENDLERKDVLEVMDQITLNAVRYIGVDIEFETSFYYHDLLSTERILESLVAAKGRRGTLPIKKEKSIMLKLTEIRELEQGLQDGNAAQIQLSLRLLFERLKKAAGNSVQISIIAVELCNILQRKMQEQKDEKGLNNDKIVFLEERINETLKKIQNETSINNVYDSVSSLYSDFIKNATKEKDKCYSNPLLDESILWIEEHWTQPISLRDVSNALNINSAYLSRLFKKYTGKTIVTFINELKMKKAKEMIEIGGFSLKEISYSLGFQNYNYFYRLFKEVYGMSPSDLEMEIMGEK